MRLASSLALRLTGALIAVTFLAIASLLAGIYYFSVRLPMEEVRDKVGAETAGLLSTYRTGGEAGLKAALETRRQLPSTDKAFDAFIGRDGRLVTGNLPSWPKTRRGDWTSIEADLYRDGDEDDHEALSLDLMLPDGKRLIVGRDVEVLADRKELMLEAARWASISVLLFGLLGGLLISRITAQRLDAVSRTARAVMKGDLSVRVPVHQGRDEFDRLGMTLNAMLDRNQELMASLGRVSDNVAHELRTPLARLRTALEGNAEDGRIEIEHGIAARHEADRLQQIFDSLLRIARLDTGRHRILREPVRFDELAGDAVEYFAPEAEARHQALTISVAPCTVLGDRNLMFQAVTNLLDNAIKFAPEGGQVSVDVEVDGAFARLVVRDNGPGVCEEHRSRLGERFFRAPGSEGVAGTGLGLSLAKAIADAHGGSLAFAEKAGEFEARFQLPVTEA